MLAYLDAGSFQIIGLAIAGGVAGVAVVGRMYWHKVLGVFSKKHRRIAEVTEGELLGVEIDPETGQPVDPEAAEARLDELQDDQPSVSDRG